MGRFRNWPIDIRSQWDYTNYRIEEEETTTQTKRLRDRANDPGAQ